MTVMQLTGETWTRKHDLPGSPLFPSVKIYYPTSLKGLIEICKSRPSGERLKAGGSHSALSTAAVSDSAFIETHDPKNRLPAMDQTLYEIVPDCLLPQIFTALKQRHPTQFDQSHLNENEGTYSFTSKPESASISFTQNLILATWTNLEVWPTN